MRYYLYLSLSVFLLSYSALEAQTDVSIGRKAFKTNKPGFSEAWEHVKSGDTYFKEKGIWYNDACNEYLQALVYNNSNAELNYKAGVAALFSDKKEDAAGFLMKAYELKKDVAGDVLLLTGRALQYAGKFQDAIAKFTAYLSSPDKKSQKDIIAARKYIQECNSAIEITKDTLRVSIENPGPAINSPDDDYSEILTKDGHTMYFASRRQISQSGKRHPDSKFDENILVSHLNNGSWTPANQAGSNLCTKYCESPLYISPGNDILYIYTGYSGKGDIKMSVNKKGIWKSPVSIPFDINTKNSETSFAISPSGNEIYFVSDKSKENIGGKDIYFIKKMSARKWSKPRNAGTVINTIYDEESVRFSRTGDTLWFSSKGHNSMGGFDIFYSARNKNGSWDTVRNAGYPINTPWDELFYTPSPVDDSSFYFVSNRTGGLGGADIYFGKILPPAPVVIAPPAPKPDTVIIRDTVVVVREIAPPPAPVQKEPDVYLTGKIADSESGAPVLAKIDLKEIPSGEIKGTTASSDQDGSYRLMLPSKKSYNVDIHATGFLSETRRIDVPDNWMKETYTLNVGLIKIKVGKKVVLNNILFETGKSVLTSASYTELDRLVGIMNENALMKIEISGHTDNTGSEPINSKLSEARAKAVVDYLIQKGIDRTRMNFRGYGSSQPVAENTTVAGRTKNRRVEFKILEF
jgi:outer membrane protein OmpA-like peptidoglycan-associated protein